MGRGIGVGLFSPWVFDRVRQDLRWSGVVTISAAALMVVERRRLPVLYLRCRASDRRASAPTGPRIFGAALLVVERQHLLIPSSAPFF